MKMEIYNKLKEVPEDCLKKITGGRLKGMSDIKPQWRILKLTETFGICGVGWKFKIINKWIEDGSNNEKVAFVDLELYIKVDDKWSEAIIGNGGSMFVAKEKHGMYTSDEAYKMAITDALGTAAKCIGLASDIYMGHGGKYDSQQDDDAPPKQNNPHNQGDEKEWLNEKDLQSVIKGAREKGLEAKDLRNYYKISKKLFAELEKVL